MRGVIIWLYYMTSLVIQRSDMLEEIVLHKKVPCLRQRHWFCPLVNGIRGKRSPPKALYSSQNGGLYTLAAPI